MTGTWKAFVAAGFMATTLGCLNLAPVGTESDAEVTWLSPTSSPAYARGTLLLEVTVEDPVEAVELYKDSTLLVRMTERPFRFNWDTTHEGEGTYEVRVRISRGGPTHLAASKTVTVDRTAPALTSKSPAANAATVSVHSEVRLTFSEPLAADSVTANAVHLTVGGTALTVSSSLSPDGQTLTLTPTLLPTDTDVSVAFDSGAPLRDLAGNPLADLGGWSFRAPIWLPLGEELSAPAYASAAKDAALKLDRAGNPYVAWTQSDGAADNVYVRRWNGTAWEAMGNGLSALSGGTAAHAARIALGPNDEPYVFWTEWDANGGGWPYRAFGRKWVGGQWLALPDFPAVSGIGRYDPEPWVDSSGQLTVFDSYWSGMSYLGERFTALPTASDWSPGSVTGPVPGGFSVARRGNSFLVAYIVNYHSSPATQHVWVADGDLNLIGADVYSSGSDIWKVSAAAASDGTPYVAWSDSSLVQVARYDGNAWAAVGTFPQGALLSARYPSLAIAPDGAPIVAFSAAFQSARATYVARWTGTEWEPIGPRLTAYAQSAGAGEQPQLVIDSQGTVTVAWDEAETSGVNKIHVYRWNH